jgi:putative oxidoreductase
MKKIVVLESICCLFFLLFVYTGVAKITHYYTFLWDLEQDPVLRDLSSVIAIGLPIVEILVASTLFVPKLRMAGLFSSFALMTFFTGYVAYMLAFRTDRPCTCGGIIRNLSWPQHLIFNILMLVLSAIGLIIQKKTHIGRQNIQTA